MKMLAHLNEGDRVEIICYQEGCERISITATLGREYKVHPAFIQTGGVGRLRWKPDSHARGFELGKTFGGSGYCNCPRCHIMFGGVIAISNGRTKKPTLFGYEAEPA
jgi:hypothetical protein